MMYTNKRAIGVILCLVTATAFTSQTADAASERWYMIANCHPFANSYEADPGFEQTRYNWSPYGYYNLSDTQELTLVCPQPHLVGTDGYTYVGTQVWDRDPNRSVIIKMCRSDGINDEVCLTGESGVAHVGNAGVNFGTDSNWRSFYYLAAIIPRKNATYGYSHLVSIFFQDN